MDWLLARKGPCRLLYQSEQNERVGGSWHWKKWKKGVDNPSKKAGAFMIQYRIHPMHYNSSNWRQIMSRHL